MMQIVPKLLSGRELDQVISIRDQDHIFEYMSCGDLYPPQYYVALTEVCPHGCSPWSWKEDEIAAIEIQLYLRMAGCLDSQVPG